MNQPIYVRVNKPKRRPLWQRWQFLGSLLVLCLGVGYLAYMGFGQSATYYVTVSELQANSASLNGKNIRVSGEVMGASIEWEPRILRLEFVLTEGGEALPVVYYGTLPNTFADRAAVMVEGKYEAGHTFEASEILTKCPSKYEPENRGAGSSG